MKDDFERTADPARDVAAPPPAPATRPVLTLDVSLYETYLAEGGLDEEQKREFLEALWTIIVGFVDLGFGIHPVQQAVEARSCEQIDRKVEIGTLDLVEFQSEGENDKGQHARITRGLSEKEDK
jgi:hypothetical protein